MQYNTFVGSGEAEVRDVCAGGLVSSISQECSWQSARCVGGERLGGLNERNVADGIVTVSDKIQELRNDRNCISRIESDLRCLKSYI